MKWLALVMLLAVPCFADEDEAIAALKTSGVTISGNASSGRKVTLYLDEHDIDPERCKRLSEVQNITSVSILNYRRSRDRYLPVIKTLKGIKKLELVGFDATFIDADLKHVAEIGTLEEVFLSSEGFTDKGILALE
jgi:hypothetical protein